MFRKYFKLPVRRDSLTDMIWDSADNRIMNGVEDHVIPEDVLDELVNVINGADIRYYIQDVSVHKSDTDCTVTLHINQELKYTMDIRGWGYLTGTCKLSSEDARRVQDSFADFIESTIQRSKRGIQ